MIQIEQIKQFFPAIIKDNPIFHKYMIKEYLQLLILDYLSQSPHIGKLTFIGGTNLRLIKGIDRFSEDLDFDCKDLSKDDFFKITDDVLVFLKRSGYNAQIRDRKNDKLTAFRRSIYFPHFLFRKSKSGNVCESKKITS